jgi:magnesium-transporting ATPase (P-type)
MGHIATMLESVGGEKSPLEKQIDQLTVWLGYIAVGAMVIVIGLGLVHGLAMSELFLLAIAMAIAAVPTGMPTVVTTLLSLGMQTLAKAGAIIKRLGDVNTLGSVSAIFTDKTGTLTLNKMTATTLVYGGIRYSVSGLGYSDVGQIKRTGGIGMDSMTAGIMARPPRPSDEQIMDRGRFIEYAIVGLVMAAVAVLAPYVALGSINSENAVLAGTLIMTTLSLGQLTAGIATRFDPGTIFSRDMLVESREFFKLILLTVGLIFVVTELGRLQTWIGTQSLSLDQWLIAVAGGILVMLVVEIIKLFKRHRSHAVSA